MFTHSPSSASKLLVFSITVLIYDIKCAVPKPRPVPQPEETEVTERQQPPIRPHRVTIPPLPSGSFDSFDSDQHKYNLTVSGEWRNKYGVNRYGVQRKDEFKLGLQYWADDEVMLMFPRYPKLRSFEKHYGRYGGLNARRFWAHWNIPEDRSANGFHSGINSDNVLGGRPPPVNSKDFEYIPNAYPKRYYQKGEHPRIHKRTKRELNRLKTAAKENMQPEWNMMNPYDMGGRPPPGKTERRKKKNTMEFSQKFIVRNKRGVTPNMKAVQERNAKMQRVRRDLDSMGFEGNMLSKLFHPRIPLKNDTRQRTLCSNEGGFQTDVYFNDNPILESLIDYDDSKVRRLYVNGTSGEYVESDEGERDYLLNPLMTTRDDPLREFVYFSKVHHTTTLFPPIQNETDDFSFNSNSSAIEEDVYTVPYPPFGGTTNILQKLMLEGGPHHYDSDFHVVTELLRRNKKIDPHKNKAFRTWMSKVVPEHAHHIDKMHETELEKLMQEKAHGMKKTYGDLFHEHHDQIHHENKVHHEQEAHAEHAHHPEQQHGEHSENDKHHIHEAALKDEHKIPRRNLLEELYLREGRHGEVPKEHDREELVKEHEIKNEHEHGEVLKDHEIQNKEEHEEVPEVQTQPPQAQQQQQQYQQQQQQQLYQQQMYQQQQQNQQYGGNNYNNYGGQGGMNGMGMGGMGMNGMGGMGMNGMGGMGMNGMGGMGMNGMGMGQMGGMGAIINAIGNNLPKLSQQQAQPQPQNQNYPNPQQTQQNYPNAQQNYQQNYPQSPAGADPNAPDPNIQNAQDAAAAQQKSAQDQEAQLQQPGLQDSAATQDQDASLSQDSSAKQPVADTSDDIKADTSNDYLKGIKADDLQLPSEDAVNAQGDNGLDNAQLGQLAQFDNGQNSVNVAAAAAG